MTNPLPPVPNQAITPNSSLTPPWLSWFNQLYTYVTANSKGGGGLVPSGTAISTTAPIEGGGGISSGLTLSLEQNGITNPFLAQMQPGTIKGNAALVAAQPQDLGPGAIKSLLDIAFSDLTGDLEPSQFPGLTGVVTSPAGSTVTTLSQVPAKTLLGNNTNAAAVPVNLTVAQVQALLAIITNATQIGTLLYPITPAETFANVTPVNLVYPTGNALRYGVDPTGTTDSTTAIQNWIDATWAMYHYQDAQGLWNGGGGAVPVLTLPPGKYMVSNTMYLPTGVTLKGIGHPANTVSHTRLVMNSTGVSIARTWTATTSMYPFSSVNPGTGLGTYYFTCTAAGGTTGSSAPNWLSAQSPGATLTDGSVTWIAQAPMTAGDNRNNPMFKFRRGTLPPSLGNGALQNSACTTTIQELEFWYVTLGASTFSNPLAGIGIGFGDYPNGGHFNFDVDAADFRFKDCVFQHSPAAIRASGISTTSATRGDGFSGNRGLGIFFENCEFDAAAAHFYIQNCYLDFYIEDCEFFGGLHRYEGCIGNVRYQGGDMSGNAYIDAQSVANAFSRFMVKGVTMEGISNYPQVGVDFSAGISAGVAARIIDIGENTCDTAATHGGFRVVCANAGRVCGNTLNDQGFNAPAGSSPSDFSAAINLSGCQNLLIDGNNITTTDTASYNGFGILSYSNGLLTSSNNFVNNNCVTGAYAGATYNGQSRYINLATTDIRGVNYDATSPGYPLLGAFQTLGGFTLDGPTPLSTSSGGRVSLGTSLNTGATGGSITPPTQVAGYIVVSINGQFQNVPFYN